MPSHKKQSLFQCLSRWKKLFESEIKFVKSILLFVAERVRLKERENKFTGNFKTVTELIRWKRDKQLLNEKLVFSVIKTEPRVWHQSGGRLLAVQAKQVYDQFNKQLNMGFHSKMKKLLLPNTIETRSARAKLTAMMLKCMRVCQGVAKGCLHSRLSYTLLEEKVLYRTLKGSISTTYLEPLKGSIHS